MSRGIREFTAFDDDDVCLRRRVRSNAFASSPVMSLAVALCIAPVGCGRGNSGGSDRPAYLVMSGDTAGWIAPCGCASNQSGGLPRRGSYVSGLRERGDVLLADVGGAPAGTSEYQRVKFEAILAGTMKMGLAAHNIGGPEAALGARYLRELAGRSGIPFVSANTRDGEGKRIAETLRIIKLGKRRIALTGVVSTKYSHRDVRIDDPREAVLALLGETPAGSYDAFVVLAYLPEDELETFTASLPEVDIVAGGPTGQTIAPRRVGPTLLASATNKGKFLIQFTAHRDGGGDRWEGKIVEMSERFADAAAQMDNLRGYLADLERRDFTVTATGLSPPLPAAVPQDYRLAGTDACLGCHAADCTSWSGSRHAKAWSVLAERGSHVDPFCQQCHTTGYGLPDGFVSAGRSPQRTNVGCESCHGPALAHVRNTKTRTPFAAADQCVRCHDRENSPNFQYEEYWPHIVHGASADYADRANAQTAGGDTP